MSTDRIEKQIELSSPISRVWRAISDSKEFSAWFRVALEGPLLAGSTVCGRITYPGYEHVRMELQVVAVIPETYLSYRWRPNAVDVDHDYSAEPTTLVELRLAALANGNTSLTIVESGFDALPAERRDEAFRNNSGGWAEQLKNIERHVVA